MSAKDLEIHCPCCESRIEVDLRTGKVLRWRKKGESDESGKPVLRESDWQAAADRVGKRLSSATDKFDDSLGREKRREKDLDDLFRKASEKLERKDDE